MASGLSSAQTPQTTMRLKKFEPTALLMERSFLPAIEALTLTEVSGRLVPMATIVIPMISDGTFSIFATLELPSTKKSAPLIRRTKPTISSTYFSIILSPFFFILPIIARPRPKINRRSLRSRPAAHFRESCTKTVLPSPGKGSISPLRSALGADISCAVSTSFQTSGENPSPRP